MRGATLTDGFTECQRYRVYSNGVNLSFLKNFYPGLTMTVEDIAQIEKWIKDHPARCLTGCNAHDITKQVTSLGG